MASSLVMCASVSLSKNLFRNHCNRCFSSSSSSAPASSPSSVDPSAVIHHGKLANNWWDESGFLKALHSMNTLRVPLVRDGLFRTGAANISMQNTPEPLKGLHIVDVGCGGGFLSEPLARLGASVTGIDASSELIEVARQHAKSDPSLEGSLTYIHTVAEAYASEKEGKFDAVVSSEVIEHVPDKSFFLEQCIKLLKPKGSFFLTTLNRTTQSWLGAIVAAENLLRIVPPGTHQWELFVQPGELQMMLEKCGCTTKLVHGMCYNPITNDWKWSNNVSINYAVHAVKASNNLGSDMN